VPRRKFPERFSNLSVERGVRFEDLDRSEAGITAADISRERDS
jgi:hypothetical protein